MVTINNIDFTIDNDGGIKPTMFVHRLTALKDTRQFKAGETEDMHICRMSDKRYQIFSATFMYDRNRHEVFTEAELHESFTEL